MNGFFKVGYPPSRYIGTTDTIIGGMREFEITRERLKALRKELGISQAELAEMANKTRFAPGLLQSRVSDIERGLNDALPTTPQLAAMSEVLQTNPGYLLGLTDDPLPQGVQSDQVVVSIEDPGRRARIQEIANALRQMPDGDVSLILQLVRRIQSGVPVGTLATREELDGIEQLWSLIFMLAGPYETQRLLDSGLRAPAYFRQMVALSITKDNKASNKGT